MGKLDGHVAIVTGSTKGIGRAIAERFAQEGASVVVNGRGESAGREVASTIRSAGGSAIFQRADVSREEDVQRLVRAAVDEFGRLTILVNNAAPTEMSSPHGGVHRVDGTVVELSSERFHKVFSAVFMGPFWGCKYSIPEIAKAGGGAILNISSIGGLLAIHGVAAYSAGKAAMHALTRSVAIEAAEHNIRCNCICPGNVPIAGLIDEIRTQDPKFYDAMTSIQLTRVGTPADIANASLFLVSDETAFVTGAIIPIDGGATCKMAVPRPTT